ncbi:MAG: hypothetical protein WA581_09970 [Candidatus Acidiferrales bacterium]
MKRKIGVAGILLATTLCLAGCALWQGVGPCYGIGCRAGLMAPHGATQQSAQAKPASAKKSKTFASVLFWRHSKPAASAAPANTPSTSTTTSSAAPKQSGGN